MGYPTSKTQYGKREIEELLPYRLIAEVCESDLWNTPLRKKLFPERFTVEERDNARRIINNAKKWSHSGLPETILLSDEGRRLWKRLGSFCKELKDPAPSPTFNNAEMRIRFDKKSPC